MKLIVCILLVGLAAADTSGNNGKTPIVTVRNGSYAGLFNPRYHQDFFLGIPYAKPARRFEVAEHLDSTWNETRPATAYPPHCYGYGPDNIGYRMSEDCLYLNVVRPSKMPKSTELPVAVWIHGGGLYMGGSADQRYNLSFIVDQSVQMKKPIIGVSLNYRLVAFGFLGGQQAHHAGATNIGFRDQRLALQWVRENIRAFGGSPDKITIWGESSGAESVTAQVLAYNGRHDNLFRAGIGQSGFGGILPRLPGGYNATARHQENFDMLVGNVSTCANHVGSPQALDCLRTANFESLNATLSQMPSSSWPPVLDGDFIADYSANQVFGGRFAQVPIMIGSNSDEGTAFGSGKGPNMGPINTDTDLRRAIQGFISPDASRNIGRPLSSILDEVLDLYPNIQSIGVPSLKTWPYILQPNVTFSEELGLQYRRGNAFFGDVYMQYLRRRASMAWSRYGLPSFAYRFDVTVTGVPEYSGATHFQEVAFVFRNLNGDGYAVNPFGGLDHAYSYKARSLAKAMSSMWVNFIVDQNPNDEKHGQNKQANLWPKFDPAEGGGAGRGVVFHLDGISVEFNDWRAEAINWLIQNDLALIGN